MRSGSGLRATSNAAIRLVELRKRCSHSAMAMTVSYGSARVHVSQRSQMTQSLAAVALYARMQPMRNPVMASLLVKRVPQL